MELGGSLPHSQQSTTCPYPSQINTFLCPSQFWQAQLVPFLVGLRTYQHPGIYNTFCHPYSIWCEDRNSSLRVKKTNLMRYLSSVCFFNQPLHVSAIFVAHHQEVYSIYTKSTNCCIYSIPPDDGLQIWPKHVEVDLRNKLRINKFYICNSVHHNSRLK